MSGPELALLPDVERLVSNFLRANARVSALVGERVYTVFPAKVGNAPLALVQRVGGDPPLSVPLVVDSAQLQVDAYGGPKAAAFELAATIRAELARLEDEVRPEGSVSAVRFASLRWLPDETFSPPRPRYLFDVTLTVRPAVVPAGVTDQREAEVAALASAS
jgi:hypothetical protein